MSIYDEYQIVINEAQRRVIMRALTNAMASDRLSTSKGGTLSRPTHDEYMQLIRLFSAIKPPRRNQDNADAAEYPATDAGTFSRPPTRLTPPAQADHKASGNVG